MSQFTNKVAFITGGTSGIGRESALAFAREGARVVITGRREKEGNAVVQEIQKNGGKGLFVKTDITRESDVANAVARTVETFGRLDIALNNAGIEEIPSVDPILKISDKDYDVVMNTNVRGVVYSLRYEIPAMLKNGGGSIVNVSSVAGLIGMAGIPIYIASKHAVIGLTKSVALEYAKKGIRVNAIAPAAIQTEMLDRFADSDEKRNYMAGLHPIGRIGNVSEIASAVLYLSSEGAGFITGTTLAVDGGFTVQ